MWSARGVNECVLICTCVHVRVGNVGLSKSVEATWDLKHKGQGFVRTCWLLYCWLVSGVMGGMDDVRDDREAFFLVPCELNAYV